ncbi:hypothetical protein BGZ51_008229 [Haplosporangium sp. Z 767]|nr:hypothetical protein BGZ51_008229 [Haplosporangium sp. Z 767]
MSGNGRYLATVASTSKPFTHLLSVWEMTASTEQLVGKERTISIQSQQVLPLDMPSIFPSARAEGVLTLQEPRYKGQERNARVSLSWDGSMVAVAEQDTQFPNDISNFFEVYHNDPYPQEAQSATALSTMATLRPSNEYKRFPEFKEFRGYGRFHITENPGPNIDQEFFIACHGDHIHIFSVHPKWCHLHTIRIVPQAFDMHIAGTPSLHLAVMEPKYGILSVWDIEQDTLTSLVQPRGSHTSHIQRRPRKRPTADIVAFSSIGHIMAVSWDKSITLHWISSGSLLGTFTLPPGSSKVNNLRFLENDTLLLVNYNRDNGNHITEAIGVVLETYSMVVVDHFVIPQACTAWIAPTVGSGMMFFSVHGSILDLVVPYVMPRIPCTKECHQALTPLKTCQHIITSSALVEYSAASGLRYRIEMLDELNSPPSFIISIYGRDAGEPKKFEVRFPRQYFDPEEAFFLEDNLRLVVVDSGYTFIWQLPATMDDDLKLEVVRYQKKMHYYSTCLHQELYSQYKVDDNQAQHIECCFQNADVQYFEREIRLAIAVYQVTDEASRKAILQYIGPYLNSHCDSVNPDDTFLATLCHWWANIWLLHEKESNNQFLLDLLASPASQWILRPDTPLKSNPIWVLLEAANTQPRVMHTAKVLMDYCFQKARAEKEVGYLCPVLQCLGALVDPNGLHTDLGMETLERLNYLPVKSREYLIDHHSIAHPPELRLDFWRSNKRPLYKCEDPILQLTNDMELQGLDEYFKRELFLVVVFLQVYGGYHGTLFGIFIAIAALSTIFLWLELIQLIADWRHYLTSLYNLADVIVFGLPLAASINHFLILSGTITGQNPRDGNAGLLSFSVLIVFLHFLFELRISQSICKFVTIIINAFIKIRMFFFLFAGATIAFTIAVLHLLHSCPFEVCVDSDPPTNFPTHFYGAISATFFYMSGRYNSVENEFDSKNWAFQSLMMTSYFFMVVLMLNVLIALINNAFSDGEATWHATWLESRLRVIETVENLSYRIPGLREHSKWFPDEIYYSILGKQIEVYQAKESEGWADSINDGNNSSATLVGNVPKPGNSSKARKPPVSSPRSSYSPIMQSKPRNSISSVIAHPDEDTGGTFSERPMQDLKSELKQARNQIDALQNQMNDMQEKLYAFLEIRAASGSSS